jgi:hypothetical protein
MIAEDARDLIADAVEQRKVKLERELANAPYERREEIAMDIEACRSLLLQLEQSPCRPPVGAIAEAADRVLAQKEEEGV